MTKYRLKKDLPDLEAGEIFNSSYDADSSGYESSSMFDSRGAYRFEKDDIKHFDEWFEEVKDPAWVRKQIKRVDTTALNKGGESGYKYTDILYRFIKPFYYDDTKWGATFYTKNNNSYQRFYMYDKPGEPTYLDKVALINQLVRDGYIEIQDNPNIVWEDEKCD